MAPEFVTVLSHVSMQKVLQEVEHKVTVLSQGELSNLLDTLSTARSLPLISPTTPLLPSLLSLVVVLTW